VLISSSCSPDGLIVLFAASLLQRQDKGSALSEVYSAYGLGVGAFAMAVVMSPGLPDSRKAPRQRALVGLSLLLAGAGGRAGHRHLHKTAPALAGPGADQLPAFGAGQVCCHPVPARALSRAPRT
jgi:hypothetical protein